MLLVDIKFKRNADFNVVIPYNNKAKHHAVCSSVIVHQMTPPGVALSNNNKQKNAKRIVDLVNANIIVGL